MILLLLFLGFVAVCVTLVIMLYKETGRRRW
jgi:hypothetical protein